MRGKLSSKGLRLGSGRCGGWSRRALNASFRSQTIAANRRPALPGNAVGRRRVATSSRVTRPIGRSPHAGHREVVEVPPRRFGNLFGMHQYSLSLTTSSRRRGRGTLRGTAAVSVLGILIVPGARGARSVQAERPVRPISELLIRLVRVRVPHAPQPVVGRPRSGQLPGEPEVILRPSISRTPRRKAWPAATRPAP